MSKVYVPWDRVKVTTERYCSCGGAAPEDPKACTACVIYHRLRLAAMVPESRPALDREIDAA